MPIDTPLRSKGEVRRGYCCLGPRLPPELVHLQDDVALRAALPLDREFLVRGPRDRAQVVLSKFQKSKRRTLEVTIRGKCSKHQARPRPRCPKPCILWLRYRVARAPGTTISIVLETLEALTTKRRTVGFGVPGWNRKKETQNKMIY